MALGPKRVPGLYECVESNGTPKMQAAGSSLDEPDISGPAPVYNSVKLITQFHISAINWQRVIGALFWVCTILRGRIISQEHQKGIRLIVRLCESFQDYECVNQAQVSLGNLLD